MKSLKMGFALVCVGAYQTMPASAKRCYGSEACLSNRDTKERPRRDNCLDTWSQLECASL